MGWLAALAACGVFVWPLIHYPKFRAAIVILLIGLVATIAYWLKGESDLEAKSHSLILRTQLELRDVPLSSSVGLWEIRGTI